MWYDQLVREACYKGPGLQHQELFAKFLSGRWVLEFVFAETQYYCHSAARGHIEECAAHALRVQLPKCEAYTTEPQLRFLMKKPHILHIWVLWTLRDCVKQDCNLDDRPVWDDSCNYYVPTLEQVAKSE